MKRDPEARRERGRQMWRMRQAGKTYPEIGEAFGVSRSRAAQIVQWAEHYKARLGLTTPSQGVECVTGAL